MLLKISSVILPDNIHQRAKALSSSFSGDDILFSRLDALSGFMAMAFSTSFSSLSDTDCCLLHPDSTNIDVIIIAILFLICLSWFSFVVKVIFIFYIMLFYREILLVREIILVLSISYIILISNVLLFY